MRTSAQVLVIGGGVVGCSVLYHLTRLGCTDVVLVERAELTAGSTWHAAAGFHALNADPNVAALQAYTIDLYGRLESESGRSIGLHMTGGVNIAGTPERWEWLQSAWAVFQTMGLEQARLVTPDEVAELVPIVDPRGIYGGLYDPNEGHVDPYGTTHAYAAAARKHGAEVVLHNRVLELKPRADGSWQVVTEQGDCIAEHVVNAAGLWAKQCGRMAGVDLPVTPMEHHYLVTEDIPEVAALGRELPILVDLEGFSYMRQEGKGVLLGIYERSPKHWHIDGAPWDYGLDLIPPDVDRIAPQLSQALQRVPCVERAGIKRWVNGAFTFTPDGNPLVGPVPGRPNYWTACGVMAAFSQGGGVGRTLAEWIVQGEPSVDAFGMDVARYGEFAANPHWLRATTAQFYSRRFVLSYPNEQLPAGRPLRRPGAHAELSSAGARWGALWGLELPLYFAPPAFTEMPTLRRSEAHEIVAEECQRARRGVALLDTTAYARYEVSGAGARAWLDEMLAGVLPRAGTLRLAPMLSPSGRLLGDLTVLNWDEQTWWIMGSYALRRWHERWMRSRLPADGVVLRDLSDGITGFSIFGPRARELLERLTDADVSNAALPFMSCRQMDVGPLRTRLARLSVTGELGYEINIGALEQSTLYETLMTAGRDLGLTCVGYNSVYSLRLEKSFGIWGREFSWGYTPGMSGLDRFVVCDKPQFIGRDAACAERAAPGGPRLVTLEIDAQDADANGFEPIWSGARRIGFVTSGAYGHTVHKSLAMAYVEAQFARAGTELELHMLGKRRPCRVIPPSPWDPRGSRMRS